MHLSRLYHTLRPLKPRQFWYRVCHPLRKKLYRPPAEPPEAPKPKLPAASLFPLPAFDHWAPATRTFTSLNLARSYPGSIDWNDTRYGALWAYHLNYFGWLYDEGIAVADRLETIQEYTAAANVRSVAAPLKTGLDGYPISLRGLAWIRFFVQH